MFERIGDGLADRRRYRIPDLGWWGAVSTTLRRMHARLGVVMSRCSLHRCPHALLQRVVGAGRAPEQEAAQLPVGLARRSCEIRIGAGGAALDECERLQHRVVQHACDVVAGPPIGDVGLGLP